MPPMTTNDNCKSEPGVVRNQRISKATLLARSWKERRGRWRAQSCLRLDYTTNPPAKRLSFLNEFDLPSWSSCDLLSSGEFLDLVYLTSQSTIDPNFPFAKGPPGMTGSSRQTGHSGLIERLRNLGMESGPCIFIQNGTPTLWQTHGCWSLPSDTSTCTRWCMPVDLQWFVGVRHSHTCDLEHERTWMNWKLQIRETQEGKQTFSARDPN